ncbi:MAG: ATP-binding protein [Prevotella sp.]|nr:ATP-binding protein [Prevotella sp.]
MARQFLDIDYLNRMIAEGEHQQQDFKYKITDACKLAKSVSAFSNTDGGRLMIGVRDDGHLSGVRSEEEVYMMQVAAEVYCKPTVQISFERLVAGGRQIVIAHVPVSDHKPIRALCDDGRYRAFIRMADENIVASPVHVRIWKDEQSPRGQVFSYSDIENKVFSALHTDKFLTLNQVVRRSGVKRPQVIVTLARMIRYGLVTCQFIEHQFLFGSLEL